MKIQQVQRDKNLSVEITHGGRSLDILRIFLGGFLIVCFAASLRVTDIEGAVRSDGTEEEAQYSQRVWALTAVGNPASRYLVNLGFPQGNTVETGSIVPGGVYDIASAGGNGGAWWQMNDGIESGALDPPSTFGGPGPDFFGYEFKVPATISYLHFLNPVNDGGTFAATPTLEVLSGGVWAAVPAIFDPPYDPTFEGVEYLGDYWIYPQVPLVKIDGVRLKGEGAGTGDGDGYVVVEEFAAQGEAHFDHSIDLFTDLTDLPGTTAGINHSQNTPANLIDNDFNSYDTSVFAPVEQLEDWVQVIFPSPQVNVGAMGIIFKFFYTGGWLDESTSPFTIQYLVGSGRSEDGGSTAPKRADNWIEVSGLRKGAYGTDYEAIEALPWSVESGFLFLFEPIMEPIIALRIIGDGGGGQLEGFLAVTEIEIFPTDGIFVDGFESGGTGRWSAVEEGD